MPKGRKSRPTSNINASQCALPLCSAPASEQACCSKCQKARYCKRAHQVADAARHGNVCIASSSGPPDQMRAVDAIFFSATETSPRIVKVNCRIRSHGGGPGKEDHQLEWSPYLGGDSKFVPHPIASVQRESFRRAYPSRLYLVFDHSAVFNLSLPVNRCAIELTQGKSAMLWRGNLLGYRARESAEDHVQFVDASMDDLPVFTQFLKHHCTVPPMPSSGRWRSAQSDDPEDMAEILANMMFGERLSDLEDELRTSGFQPPPPRSRNRTSNRRANPTSSSSEWTDTDASDETPPKKEVIRQMIREEFRIQQDEIRALLRNEVANEVWVGVFQLAVLIVAAYFGWHWLLFPMTRFFYGGAALFLSTAWNTLKWALWFVF